MQEPLHPKTGMGEDDKRDIVETLFDVALDPTRYESLLDLWEERIAPLRVRDGLAGVEFKDAILEGHIVRADLVLDRQPERALGDPLGLLMTSLLPTAAFVLNGHGAVVQANVAARAVFGLGSGQHVTALPFDPMQCEQLRMAAADIARGRADDKYVRCVSGESERLVVIRLSGLVPGEYGAGLVLAVSTEFAWPGSLSLTIRDAFQLTSAEIDIVRALVEGATVNEIAQARVRSVETVRTQVRSILSKTQTKTQSELIRVMLNLMDVVGVEARRQDPMFGGSTAETLKPLPFSTLVRPDGRRCDYVVLGDPEGEVIIFLPGNYGLCRWPRSAERALEREGLRVIVPVRPGWGDSTKLAKNADREQVIAGDLAALLDHLRVASAPVIANVLDMRNAYYFDKAFPGRLTAIINCGGGFPVISRLQYERMGKWHRFAKVNALHAPIILPFLIKAGYSLARRIGRRNYLLKIYESSPADAAALDDPEIMEAIDVGTRVNQSERHSAHEAFAEEVILSARDWSELITRCRLPKICFIGRQDTFFPAASMPEIREAFSDIDYREYGDIGELVFLKHWRDILDCAKDYLPGAGKIIPAAERDRT